MSFTNLAVLDGNGSAQSLTSNAEADGSLKSQVSTDSRRGTGSVARSAITAADKVLAGSGLPTLLPGALTSTGETITSGVLVSGTTYYYCYYYRTALGVTPTSALQSSTPGGSNNAIRLTIPTNTSATAVGICLGTSNSAPILVGEVPLNGSGQIAAGTTITTAFVYGSAGSAPAGSIDIGVAGSGSANTAIATMYVGYNTAYVLGGLTGVNCAGYRNVVLEVNFGTLTDLRITTSVTILPFLLSTEDSTYYPSPGGAITFTVGGGAGYCLKQMVVLETYGCAGFLPVVDQIQGQGAAVTINVTPV